MLIIVVNKKPSTKQKKAKPAKVESSVGTGPLPVPRELLVAGVALDPSLEIERQQRMESLKAHLLGMIAEGKTDRTFG
jgi:hypothetical protein